MKFYSKNTSVMFLKPSPEHYKTHTTNKQYYTEKVWRRFSNWRQQYSSLRFSVWSKERPRDDIIAVKCTRHNSRMYFYDWKCVSGLKWSQKDIPAVSDKEKNRHRHRVSETCQLSKSSSLVPPILKYHINNSPSNNFPTIISLLREQVVGGGAWL